MGVMIDPAVDRPLVTVFIVNWNRVHDLQETLICVSRQEYRPLEVLVIDNGSTDGAPEMVVREFPSVRLIRNEENVGHTRGCNQGIELARGEILVKMDNDAVFERPDAVDSIVNALTGNPSAGIAAPCVLNYHTRVKENGPYDHFVFAAAGFKKSMFAAVGSIAEIFYVYAEEQDLTVRAEAAGYSVVFLPDVIALHKSAPSQRSADNGFYLKTRNVYWIFWRNYPFWMAVRQSVRHTILTFYVALKSGRLGSFFRALFVALARLPEVLQERRPLDSIGHCIIYPEPLLSWVIGRFSRGRYVVRS